MVLFFLFLQEYILAHGFEDSECYTKTRLCLLSFRIFPSLCLAVAIPFLGRLPERKKKKTKETNMLMAFIN